MRKSLLRFVTLIYFLLMDANFNELEGICGKKPQNVDIVDVGNNPNFVFQNDSTYDAITLYDLDGNIVNVNSWFECFHYVNGGWVSSVYQLSNTQEYFLILLFFVSTCLTITFRILKNKK